MTNLYMKVAILINTVTYFLVISFIVYLFTNWLPGHKFMYYGLTITLNSLDFSYFNPWAWYRWVRPHTLLNRPWRMEGDPKLMNEKLDMKLRKEITETEYGKHIKKAGVIVLGPSQSGKSSFINSLLSCMKKRISKMTVAKGSDNSVTVQLLTVTGKELNIWLCDTMGMNINKCVTGGELKSILKGKLGHGYMFGNMKDTSTSEKAPEVSDKKHEDTPVPNKDASPEKKAGASDEIQIAVIVLAADVIDDIPSDHEKESGVREQINKTHGILKESGVLQIYILTKVDVICAEVRKDPKMIFQSRAVQKMVKKVHDIFGPDENDIYPVVNYVAEIDTNTVRNIPLLFALRHIVRLASDHAENYKE